MKTITFFAVLLLLSISFSSFIISNQVTSHKFHDNKSYRIQSQGRKITLVWPVLNGVRFRIECSKSGEKFVPVATAINKRSKPYNYTVMNHFFSPIHYRIFCVRPNQSEKYLDVQVVKMIHA